MASDCGVWRAPVECGMNQGQGQYFMGTKEVEICPFFCWISMVLFLTECSDTWRYVTAVCPAAVSTQWRSTIQMSSSNLIRVIIVVRFGLTTIPSVRRRPITTQLGLLPDLCVCPLPSLCQSVSVARRGKAKPYIDFSLAGLLCVARSKTNRLLLRANNS